MPPRKTIPAPIDRPLSKAYLRGFTGWSTAYPPEQSEPTSLRIMENVMVNRNGALAVRPGLRYLSYEDSPDMDPSDDTYPGLAFELPLVGGQEPFYTLKGDKALLFAVRETDGTVGFRAILMTDPHQVVHQLTDPRIDFDIPQGASVMNFSAATTHVEYLQINNRIIAMSDAGEDIRVFFVGLEKVAKRMANVSVPEWTDADKLTAIHPDAAWVATQTVTTRTNELLNPSFEIGTYLWTPSATSRLTIGKPLDPVSGSRTLRIESRPARTNMITNPLYDLNTLPENSLVNGWYPLKQHGHDTRVLTDHGYLRVFDQQQGEGPFLAYSAKAHEGVEPGQKYRLAFDYTVGQDITPQARLTFHSVNGAKIGNDVVFELPEENGRWVSDAVPAPPGTVTIRAWVGGTGNGPAVTYIRVKDVVLCRDGESTALFHGSSGTNYFWTGAPKLSASVYHPPQTVKVTSARVSIPRRPLSASASVRTFGQTFTLALKTFNRVDAVVNSETAGATPGAGAWFRAHVGASPLGAGSISAEMSIESPNVPRGQYIEVDACMLESNTSLLGTYFDGSTDPTDTTSNSWADRYAPHASPSRQRILLGASMPVSETATADTLIATGGAAANEYKIGLFYTFENEVGESAPSKVTEVRVSRPWANWRWETANAAGEPSGTATDTAELCADQLIVRLPEAVYEQALAEGAVKWHLYAMSWSDQEPVPVEASRVATRDILVTALSTSLPYLEGALITLTPQRRIGVASLPLPSQSNRVNYSTPPRSRNGLIAGDRVILVGDPTELSTIKWSANAFSEYTNFSAAAGGGEKTLTSGNLNLPVSVVLWQNPQSVDTITILCQGEDGYSSAYYMSPATVQAASGVTTVMGFEETTNTPGTLSPYAAEVMNNGLYRPTMMALLKSTAQNYNINHKTMSDKIANMWQGLQEQYWMMTAQLDNRLYLLVNNPRGAALEPGCRGNEIWVLDIGSENGNWSRFLIQAAALRPFDIGGRTYMGVTRPEGLYYLDPEYRRDDYVTDINEVYSRPIPWRIETNTQGANRAHDAWAHLQQVQVTFGSWQGKVRYGVRGKDLNGTMIDVSKIFSDERAIFDSGYEWALDDRLRVARDMMEWEFFAESLDGEDGTGLLAVVQYRYAPVSVNVGTEFGSVETFEYGSNVAEGPDGYSSNGIPLPYMDYRRN